MTSPIEPRPVASMSFEVIVSTGVWPSTSAFLMREPVTSTASSFWMSSPPRSCAKTGTAYEPDTTAPASNGMHQAPDLTA